jgi:hypothetical protein
LHQANYYVIPNLTALSSVSGCVNIDSMMSTIAVESAMFFILSDPLPLNEGTAIGSARALYIGTN